MPNFSVLVVDNETGIRELIAFNLIEAGMSVSHAASGKDALRQLGEASFDLVILDIMMEDMDGYEVLIQIREKSFSTPVIFVSARNEDFDKIHGLGLGADDYVTKPFSPLELVARVKANIRRSRHLDTQTEQNFVEVGSLRLETLSQMVYIDQIPVQLTATESLLLHALMNQPNLPITKVNLFRQVWDLHQFDENMLNVAINRLRQKIEDDPKKPRRILTIWGIGYRLIKD